jgi:hypothetical protein
MERRKISLQEIVALDSTREARNLVVKYGLPKARNTDDLIEKLDYITAKHREKALKDLALIHPDKDLILSQLSSNEVEEKQSAACGCKSGFEGDYSNCGGCTSCVSCNKTGFDGSETKSEKKSDAPSDFKQYIPYLAVGTLFLVGLHLIVKNS